MDHNQLNFDLRHAPSLKLLRRDTAALIISFLHRAFKRAQLASIPLAELTAGLDTYLEQLSEAHPGQYPLSAAAYLKLWSSEEYQLLRITTRGSEEPRVELTAEAERAIGWVEERYRRSFVSTESRLRSIVLLLEEIVAKSTEDVPTRLQQLEAQRAAIQAEIDSIRATGQVSPTTSTSVKERFLLASDLARQMRRDFAEVEQNFRAVARALQERQLDPAARRGDLVGFMLDADAELRESDQGRSFYAFWEFLMAPARQDELTTLLDTIYRLPVLADLTPDHQLLRRLTRALTDAGEKVVLSNHRLAEQVRRLLDDRRLAESRRAAELIAAVKQLAVRCAERPPKDDPFIELDGPPELQFVMDRPLWEQRKRQVQHIRELLAFDDFAALDWRADARQIEELERRRRELEASSNKLAELNAQLAAVTEHITALDGDLGRFRGVIATLRQDLERYGRQRAAAERLAATGTLPPGVSARIEEELRAQAPNLDTIDERQAQTERFFTQSANSFRGRATPLRDAITRAMADFKRDYPEDTADMDASIAAVGEYRRLHDRIARDDLPTHRRRFKEWLDGKVLDAIIGFNSSLNKQVDEYRESVTRLNESLATIDYSGSTYIQLRANQNQDRAIQEFRLALRACMPDVGQRTPEANEQSFQRIRALIDRFDRELPWASKVTDTRNWLDFAAEELYRADGSRKNYYEDSSGKSGGQKAKLAYTILASAIAYQYGLAQDGDQTRTFRFVVVDEAFSKLDETNARYAMDLFRQLNLQLLVVTPLDKTHVVEPYIGWRSSRTSSWHRPATASAAAITSGCSRARSMAGSRARGESASASRGWTSWTRFTGGGSCGSRECRRTSCWSITRAIRSPSSASGLRS